MQPTNAVLKATPVCYYAGRTLLNPQDAVLSWDSNNQISLTLATNPQPLFSCQPTDIALFRYWSDHTTIKLRNGQRFMVNINIDYQRLANSGTAAHLAGSAADLVNPIASAGAHLAGLGYDVKLLQADGKNDSGWWLEALSNFGVKTRSMSMGKLLLWMIGGPIALIVVLFLVLFLVAAVNTVF